MSANLGSTASEIINQGREVVASSNIFDRAVLLSVEIGKLGIRRKVESSEVTVDADKTMLHVSKEILQADSLKAINRHDADTRLWIRARSIPSKFRAGTFLVSLGLVAEVDEYLLSRQERRADLVRSFLWEYARLCDEARVRLGVLFHSRDYPRVSRVEAAFTMEWSYVEMSAPGRLESISSEIYRRAKEQAAGQWQNAIDEGKNLLRSEFQGMVNHLADVLTPGADGQVKRIKAPDDKRSWLSDFQDFLGTFRNRDLAGDEELGSIVEQIKRALGGVPIASIKTDDQIREQLRSAMAVAQESLSSMVITGVSGRSIDMDEDDEQGQSAASPVASDSWQLV
jgi:hypothetical protein